MLLFKYMRINDKMIVFQCVNTGFKAPLAAILDYSGDEMEQECKQVLEGWDCSTFIKETLNDPDIEQLKHKVADIFKRILDKYSQVENSSDGVQAIILCDDSYCRRLFCKDLILDALWNAKITGAKSEFVDIFDKALLMKFE